MEVRLEPDEIWMDTVRRFDPTCPLDRAAKERAKTYTIPDEMVFRVEELWDRLEEAIDICYKHANVPRRA